MTDHNNPFTPMTDAELADWQYAHKAELEEDFNSAEEVQFEIDLKKRPRR